MDTPMNTPTDTIELPANMFVTSASMNVSDDNIDVDMDELHSIADNIDEVPKLAEIKYGPTGDGEYVTPYNMTVVYHETSLLETAVAFLTSRAQIIPIYDDIDYNTVADSCEFLTPEVLIFGTDFPLEAVEKFITRGFKFVHIYTEKSAGECIKYNSSEYFKSMSVFDITTLPDHVVIIDGLVPVLALKHIMDGHQRRSDGVYFCEYLSGTGKHVGKELLQMTSSFRGFEEIDKMIIRGKYAHELRETMARNRIDNAVDDLIEGTKVLTMYGGDLTNVMLNLLPVHPRIVNRDVKFALFYELVKDEIETVSTDTVEPTGAYVNAWKITAVGVGAGAPSALEFMRKFSAYPTGDYGNASVVTSKVFAIGNPKV